MARFRFKLEPVLRQRSVAERDEQVPGGVEVDHAAVVVAGRLIDRQAVDAARGVRP